jgi:hypothetical protein
MNYDIKTPALKDDLLVIDLVEPTEVKDNQAATTLDFAPDPKPADFAPPPPDPAGPGPRRPDPGQVWSQPANDPEPIDPAEFEAQAKLYLAFADGVQALALPYLYQKQNFTPEQLSRLAEINSNPEAATPDDTELKAKGADFAEFMENLPFSSKEEKLMLGPLTKVLQKYNHAPGPETALMMAAFTVMAPRVLPLIKFGK